MGSSPGSTLLNGRIEGFGAGVNGAGGTLENMTIIQNGAGISAPIAGGQLFTISDSSISDNQGPGLEGSSFFVISDSRVVDNAGDAIRTNQGLTMTGSTVADNGGDGINRTPAVNLLDNSVSLTNDDFMNNDVLISTPYTDSITITGGRFINSGLSISTAGTFLPSGIAVSLVNNLCLNSSRFGNKSIAVSVTSGPGLGIYVADNRFINCPLVIAEGTLIDGGGNTGI